MYKDKENEEACENCGFISTLYPRQGYQVCCMCVAWLDWIPGRILKVRRDNERRSSSYQMSRSSHLSRATEAAS